jgi:hypothetical protein
MSILTAKGLLHSHTFEGKATRFEPADRLPHNRLVDVETRQKRKRRFRGRDQLPKAIEGVNFTDGVEAVNDTINRVA